MPDPKGATGRLTPEPSEEIVEKKPTSPVATALLIITAVALGLMIFICLDWLNLYFAKSDYDAERGAKWHWERFAQEELVSPAALQPKWLKKIREGAGE